MVRLAFFVCCLMENKVIHKYYTRRKDDFHIDAIKSEIGKRSIKYKGSKLWNDLPAELKRNTVTLIL